MYIPFGWRKGDKPELVWGSFLALLHFFLKVPNQQDQSSHSVRAQGSRPKTKGSKIPKAALLLRKLSCLVDIQHHHLPCHHALLVTVTQCNLNVITLWSQCICNVIYLSKALGWTSCPWWKCNNWWWQRWWIYGQTTPQTRCQGKGQWQNKVEVTPLPIKHQLSSRQKHIVCINQLSSRRIQFLVHNSSQVKSNSTHRGWVCEKRPSDLGDTWKHGVIITPWGPGLQCLAWIA